MSAAALLSVGLLLMIALLGFSVVISLSEMSFAAAREARIRGLARTDRRAARFLALRRDSGRVVTALQICLNAVGILAGMLSDRFIAAPLTELLQHAGAGDWARQAGIVLGFCLVTGSFVLLSDLVPKRAALIAPERVALSVAWFPSLAIGVLRPVVWLFAKLSNVILRLLRLPTGVVADPLTAEDLRATLAAGTASGALLEQEHRLITNVLGMQDRSVTSAMTPRDEIVYLDLDETPEARRDKVRARPYSRYPLCRGGIDNVVGAIRAEDVLASTVQDGSVPDDFARMRRDVLSIPDTLNLWEALAQFEAFGAGFAVVVSEYGLVVGLLTFKDVMGAVMDGLANPFDEQVIVRRDDQSWLIDGLAPLADVARALEVDAFEASGLYETIGGFVSHRLRRMARKADRVEYEGLLFEVVDVEGFRINQLLVTRRTPPPLSAEASASG